MLTPSSIGTHGYFKATFDGKISPMDAVGVSLYKRVWPRGASAWSMEKVENSDTPGGKITSTMEIEAT